MAWPSMICARRKIGQRENLERDSRGLQCLGPEDLEAGRVRLQRGAESIHHIVLWPAHRLEQPRMPGMRTRWMHHLEESALVRLDRQQLRSDLQHGAPRRRRARSGRFAREVQTLPEEGA